MSTSDKICYLKGNELYYSDNGILRPITLEEIESLKSKISLILEDKFFFYVGMDNVSVSGKKLRSVAKNYLNIIFANHMINNFGVFQGKGYTLIYIISPELISIIEEYPNLFSIAKKITTPFIELTYRYNDFIYTDGIKSYKKDGSLILSTEEEATFTVNDFFSEIALPVTNIHLPGISKLNFIKAPIILPAATVAICYIFFLIGNIVSLNSIANTEKKYEEMLNNLYKSVNIDTNKDPYGMLLYKSGNSSKNFNGKRVVTIIDDLQKISKDIGKMDTLSIRDKSVRVNGMTEDFTKIELLKKKAEEVLKTSVTMDDTKKTDKGVTFVMRYEQ